MVNEFLNPQAGFDARKKMESIERTLTAELAVAMDRGRDERIRREALGDLFSP